MLTTQLLTTFPPHIGGALFIARQAWSQIKVNYVSFLVGNYGIQMVDLTPIFNTTKKLLKSWACGANKLMRLTPGWFLALKQECRNDRGATLVPGLVHHEYRGYS